MDSERIIRLSGQGSVYIRCLEPLKEEDKGEEDEKLMTPAYHRCSDDLTENPSTSQKKDDEPASTDPRDALILEDRMPYFSEIRDNHSIVNNYNASVNINDVF